MGADCGVGARTIISIMDRTPRPDFTPASVAAFKLRAAALRRATEGRCVGDSAVLIRLDRDGR